CDHGAVKAILNGDLLKYRAVRQYLLRSQNMAVAAEPAPVHHEPAADAVCPPDVCPRQRCAALGPVDIHGFRRHVCRERNITRHTFHLPACRLALQVRSVHTSARRRQYLCTIMVSARYRVGMPAEDIEAPGIADALAVHRKALDAAEAAPPGPRKTSLLRRSEEHT